MKLFHSNISIKKLGIRKLFFCFPIILLLFFQSCKSPEPTSPGDDTEGDTSNPDLVTVNTTIILPANSPLKAEDLTLTSAIDQEYPISADGSVSHKVYKDDMRLVRVYNSNGDIVMMGWVDPSTGKATISARTTAEALIYFDTGGWQMPDELQSALIKELASSTEIYPVKSAVESALSNSPYTITGALSVLTPICAQTAAKLLGLDTPAPPATDGVRIQPPTPKSGITILQPGLNDIVIRNDFRRRAIAYIDRVSPAAEIKKLELSATKGATSFWGAVNDITAAVAQQGLSYIWNLNNSAYSGVSSETIDLPVVPDDAIKTEYKVTVVGMGVHDGSIGSLSTSRQNELSDLIKKSVVIDFLVPFVTTTILPLKGDAINKALKNEKAQGAISLLINTLAQTAPNIWKKALSGNVKGAIQDGINALLTDGLVQESYLDFVKTLAEISGKELGKGSKFLEVGKSFVKAIGGVDAILTGFDTFAQARAFDNSALAETWDITVNKSKVKLTPQLGDIVKGDKISFTATVPSATGDNAPKIEYQWSTTGAHGNIKDNIHQGKDFTTTANVVEYISDGSTIGDDSVKVEAFEINGQKRNSIGDASVNVKIRELRITITPRKKSLWPPDVQKFQAEVPDELKQSGDEFSYSWSTSGTYGGFVTGGNYYVSPLDVASWIVHGNNSEGTDNVTVEVFRMRNGQSESLGNATAEILVEQKKTVIEGSWGIEEKEADAGRSCANAYIYVPKVEDAIQYDMDAYNFNDPLYFGKEYVRTWTGPQGDHGAKSTPIEDLGSQWRIGLSGGCGPDDGQGDRVSNLKSRFAGMVVQVTVKRGN